MREALGNLWTYDPDALLVITTNGMTNAKGCAVMGRGCAEEARDRFPALARALGTQLAAHGNHAWLVPAEVTPGVRLATLPTKEHWKQPSPLALVERSVRELVALVDAAAFERVVLPRPGCGNGELDYEDDVRPLLASLLDDRFTVITFALGRR